MRIEIEAFSDSFFLIKRGVKIIFHLMPFNAVMDNMDLRGICCVKF